VSTYAWHVSITLGQHLSNNQKITLLFIRIWRIYDVTREQHCWDQRLY